MVVETVEEAVAVETVRERMLSEQNGGLKRKIETNIINLFVISHYRLKKKSDGHGPPMM